MFINFSNHPYALWSAEQQAAAQRYGKVVDLAFPAIDPAADEAALDSLATVYADHILHRKGSDDYTAIRRATVTNPDEWEEVAVAEIPDYSAAQYSAKVSDLIRARYDVNAELAILRQRDTKPEEFAAYNAFAESCKADAKILLVREKAEREAEFAAAQKAAQSEGEVEAQPPATDE